MKIKDWLYTKIKFDLDYFFIKPWLETFKSTILSFKISLKL